MRKHLFCQALTLCAVLLATAASCETIDVLIKGVNDGRKTTKQRDYMQAVMNAKLQAIERAGAEIRSITVVEDFQLKYDLVESRAKAVLLPGFQIMDMGYQTDGTYQVVLSGKVQVLQPGAKEKAKGPYWGKLRSEGKFLAIRQATTLWRQLAGTFRSDYVDNRDGTVTDWTTGLMWMKADLQHDCYNAIDELVHNELNNKSYAGHSDWRVPTLEELASIVTRKPVSKGEAYSSAPNYKIDRIFFPPKWALWSTDHIEYRHGDYFRKYCKADQARQAGIFVGLYSLQEGVDDPAFGDYVEGVFIKAVRSVGP